VTTPRVFDLPGFRFFSLFAAATLISHDSGAHSECSRVSRDRRATVARRRAAVPDRAVRRYA
jgi:hypothetical protein